MKKRHNKKRNTAFVYEALVREATVAVLRKDTERHNKVVNILKKHFGGASLLKKEMECYRALYENQSLDETTSLKVLKEARMQRASRTQYVDSLDLSHVTFSVLVSRRR